MRGINFFLRFLKWLIENLWVDKKCFFTCGQENSCVSIVECSPTSSVITLRRIRIVRWTRFCPNLIASSSEYQIAPPENGRTAVAAQITRKMSYPLTQFTHNKLNQLSRCKQNCLLIWHLSGVNDAPAKRTCHTDSPISSLVSDWICPRWYLCSLAKAQSLWNFPVPANPRE